MAFTAKGAMRISVWIKTICLAILFFGTARLWYLVVWIGPGYYSYRHTDTHARCTIPRINPFDKDIMAYYWTPKPIVCSRETDLVYIDFNETMHVNYSRSSAKSLNCSYRSVIRKPLSDFEVTLTKPVWFSNTINVTSDLVKVQCYHQDNLVYERYHAHIYKSRNQFVSDRDRYSILVVGVDSMSRLAAIRELPKTLAYLQKTLKGIILNGYTKHGGNTFPNLVAFLTGKMAYSNEFPIHSTTFLNEKTFFWDNVSDAGGATMFSEDWPRLSTFNYALMGFNQTPTHHYFRPFYLAIEKIQKYLMYLENKNIMVGKTSTFCHGDRPRHVIQLDYFKRFVTTYKNQLKFALSWFNEISHDFVNFIKLADNDLLDLFKFLKEGGHLKRTFLFFISDHGSRVDEIRNTPIGRLEERLPFFSIVVPERIQKAHPNVVQNLLTNIDRLTTPFDAHETLIDIFLQKFENSEIKRPYPRGISLFKQIPNDRSCADAEVDEQSCACDKLGNVDINSRIIQQASEHLVTKLNEDLSIFKNKCAILTLNKIMDAKKVLSPLQHNERLDAKTFQHYFRKPQEATGERYLVLISVLPSFGMFEATIEKSNSNKFSVLGHVSRTNRYGNQSACINSKIMKPYCYCNS